VRQRFWDGQDKMLRDDVTKIKGNHLITFGGQYQRNYDLHQRNDNGQGIMNSPVYQITSGGGMTYPSQYRPTGVPSAQISNYEKLYSEVLGIVDQSQDLFTRTGPQLTLQPPGSFMYDQSIIPSYNVYFTDTWLHSHLRSELHVGNAALRVEREAGRVDGHQRTSVQRDRLSERAPSRGLTRAGL
jgi:hypothetical protein